MSDKIREAPLLDRVKDYSSSWAVQRQPWLALLMHDVIVELERLAAIDAAADRRYG